MFSFLHELFTVNTTACFPRIWWSFSHIMRYRCDSVDLRAGGMGVAPFHDDCFRNPRRPRIRLGLRGDAVQKWECKLFESRRIRLSRGSFFGKAVARCDRIGLVRSPADPEHSRHSDYRTGARSGDSGCIREELRLGFAGLAMELSGEGESRRKSSLGSIQKNLHDHQQANTASCFSGTFPESAFFPESNSSVPLPSSSRLRGPVPDRTRYSTTP